MIRRALTTGVTLCVAASNAFGTDLCYERVYDEQELRPEQQITQTWFSVASAADIYFSLQVKLRNDGIVYVTHGTCKETALHNLACENDAHQAIYVENKKNNAIQLFFNDPVVFEIREDDIEGTDIEGEKVFSNAVFNMKAVDCHYE